MSQRFKNKVIMITGAGSGLGRAVAERLAAEGDSLAVRYQYGRSGGNSGTGAGGQ